MNVTRLGVRRALASVTRPTTLTSFNSIQQRWSTTAARLPALTNEGDSNLKHNGIKGLYSPMGFEYAWLDYQTYILNGLLERYAEASSERKFHDAILDTPLLETLMTKFARQPQHAAIFNYASMAYNNEFFFRGIRKDLAAEEKTEIPADVQKTLELNFGSVENFKSEFLANANAIFGGGFVWLVSHRIRVSDSSDPYTSGQYRRGRSADRTARVLKIMRTYNAGSPLSGAHWRAQSQDIQQQSMYEYAQKQFMIQQAASAETYTPEEKNRRIRKLVEELSNDDIIKKTTDAVARDAPAFEVQPLLCVSVWEHSYIVDWRVNNRKQYLESWWDRIDWDRLRKYPPFGDM